MSHFLLATAGRLLAFMLAMSAATGALATFHTYRIEQIYSNADGTIQFVVLKEALGQNGQEFWSTHELISTSSGSPPKVFVFPHDLPGDNTAKTRVLVGTASFAALGIVTPDYVVPDHFLSTMQGSLDFAEVDLVSWSSLPSDGTTALDRTQQAVPNVATNFAGQSASVTAAMANAAKNYEGLWWNSPAGSESGWGINFAHQGDVIFATWFTYDATGKAWWLSMTANKTADATYGGTLYQTAGPAFSAVPFDPAKVTATPVGNATLHFTDDGNGTFAYTVNGVSQTKAITRQAFAPLPRCTFGATANLAAATNYQDLWWKAPEGSESGWGVNLTHQGDIIFATWFTYGADGKPLWLSVTTQKIADRTYSGDLYRTGGPAFSAVPFDPKKVTVTKVGTVTLTFANGNAGTFTYTVDGVAQSKPITRQVFQSPGTVCESASTAKASRGVWVGTTTANEPAIAIVAEDGTYSVIYASPGTTNDAGVVQGTSGDTAGAFTSTDATNFPVAQAAEAAGFASPATVGGTFVPASQLNLTITTRTATRALAAAYVAGSDQPPALAAVAGTYLGYTGHVGGRRAGSFIIDAAGNVSGSNDIGCEFTGTLAPHAALRAFDWTITAKNINCIFGHGPISGILYYEESAQKIHGFARFDLDIGVKDQYFMIGTKP